MSVLLVGRIMKILRVLTEKVEIVFKTSQACLI